jgi:hypothetical protein
MTLTPEEQAALAAAAAPAATTPPAQDPPAEVPAAVQPAATPPPAAAAPSQGSPWDADLASTFEDEATRNAVSAFLGQRVQPHVTRVEQASKAGRELIEALNSDPDGTIKQIVEAVYEEEDAKAILAAFDEDADLTVQPPPETTSDLDPRVQRLIDKEQEEQDKAAFMTEFNRVKDANPDVDLDFDLFVPFVAKAGDFDQAVLDYANYLTRFRESAGGTQPTPPEGETAGAEGPPATLGTGTATGVGSAPTEKEYNGDYGAAIEDYMAEQRIAGGTGAPPIPA